MRRGYMFSLLIFFLCISVSFAQVPGLKFEHIGSESGLPQNTIHGIVKDKYGFMWFGTWDGLCRYDGYSFKIYRFDPVNKNSLNNSRVHNIIKDSNNDIWILTFKGEELCRYNYERDNFDRIPVSKVSPSFFKLLHRWNHYESIRCSFKQYKWKLDLHTNSLLQWDTISNKKKYYDSNPADRWTLSDPYAVDIYKDNHNIFWVGTFSNGISKANLNAKPFEYFYHDSKNPKSIINNHVRALCEDKQGNLWVGTYDKGITLIGKDGSYRHIVFSGDDKINYTHNQVKIIFCDSRGVVWIGTKKGMINYNPATKAFREFEKFNNEHTSVYGILEDKDHNVWFATFWRGLYKYNPSKDDFVNFDFEKTLLNKNARIIIQDRKKQIWVGTEGGGVTVLKPVRDTIQVVKRLYQDQNNPNNSISDDRINSIYEDSSGLIWIGTGNGLDCYDPVAKKFIRLPKKTGLANIAISGIIGDDKGYLWISHKKGISKLNRKNFASRNYTLQDGLQSNEFSDGVVYKSRFSKKLYFGGNNGFNAFDPDSILSEKTVPNTVLTDLEVLNHKVGVNENVNGRIILNKPLYLTKEIELTYEDKSFAIEFAGLHYSNPRGNKYAFKLEGFDDTWVYTDASRRIASYANLEPGHYTFKVISSNSDGVWNLKPAMLSIVVKPPFWASTWAYILYGLIVLGIIYIYHYYSTKFARLQSKLAYESLIREKENELHQSKLHFFTNISHEIKTPLTLILAPIERLSELFLENKAVQEQLMAMKSSGDRLLKLVNQLLDFRKLETGNAELNPQKNDIVAFINKVIEPFRLLAEMKNISLEFVNPVNSFSFYFDDDKLEKVIANLLSNALKFTPASGWIKVKLNREGINGADWAVIEVINIGKGISDSDQDRIFKPFQQGSGKREGGTGLGLAYSKSLIELHGGSISLSSSELEDSLSETCFRIILPLTADRGMVEKISDKEDIKQNGAAVSEPLFLGLPADIELPEDSKEERLIINGKQPVVLLVEDNTELRTYLKLHFEKFYQIREAENGKDGLVLALQKLPDLIISDVMMAEMDGLEFCKSIKSDIRTAHIPVILLTARAPIEDRIEGIETGADDYITKPFSLKFLTIKARNLLIDRNKLKEKYRKEINLEPTADVPLSVDEKLLKKLLQYIEERLVDPELNVDDICSEVGVGRTQLYKKVKSLTGLSIAEMIREIRLKRAKQLLQGRKFNVNEVAYMVGFSDADYFRRCFKAEFGITPSEYNKGLELKER